MGKLLSFAIPCYNSAEYMEHCINTVLAGGDEVEVIIVDDGSTKDNTYEIAKRYEKEYPDIVNGHILESTQRFRTKLNGTGTADNVAVRDGYPVVPCSPVERLQANDIICRVNETVGDTYILTIADVNPVIVPVRPVFHMQTINRQVGTQRKRKSPCRTAPEISLPKLHLPAITHKKQLWSVPLYLLEIRSLSQRKWKRYPCRL